MTIKSGLSAERLPNSYFYLILASLTLIAAGLRLYQLGRWSLWIDEMITLQHAANIVRKISPGTFVYGFLYGQSLSTILTGIAVYIWGTAEWAGRLMPAITGIVTVPVAGMALRNWVGDRVALLTSLFITLSAWHVYWSQNIRYLTMQLLIYTLLFLLIYLFWQRRQYILLLIIGPLLFLLNLERLTGLAFVLITFTLYLLTWLVWQYRGQLRSMLTGRNILLLTTPILLFLGAFIWRVWQYSDSWLRLMERRNNTMLSIVGEYSLSVRPMLFILGILGLVYVWRKYSKDHIWFLLSLAAIVPLVIIMLASFLFFTTPRYMFPAFIFWLALAALVLLLIIFLADSANQLWRYHAYQEQMFRPDWKGAFTYVEGQLNSGDVIVTTDWRKPLAEYYLDDNVMVDYNVMLIEERDLTNLESVVSANGTAWFVLLEARIEPARLEWLAFHQPELVYDTIEVQVYRYNPR
jgi:hypothetical protein